MKVIKKFHIKELIHSITPIAIFFIFVFHKHIITGIILGYFYLSVISFIYVQLKEASILTYIILIFDILFFAILVPLTYL